MALFGVMDPVYVVLDLQRIFENAMLCRVLCFFGCSFEHRYHKYQRFPKYESGLVSLYGLGDKQFKSLAKNQKGVTSNKRP